MTHIRPLYTLAVSPHMEESFSLDILFQEEMTELVSFLELQIFNVYLFPCSAGPAPLYPICTQCSQYDSLQPLALRGANVGPADRHRTQGCQYTLYTT